MDVPTVMKPFHLYPRGSLGEILVHLPRITACPTSTRVTELQQNSLKHRKQNKQKPPTPLKLKKERKMSSLLRKETHSAFLSWGKEQRSAPDNFHCRSRTNTTQLISKKQTVTPDWPGSKSTWSVLKEGLFLKLTIIRDVSWWTLQQVD